MSTVTKANKVMLGLMAVGCIAAITGIFLIFHSNNPKIEPTEGLVKDVLTYYVENPTSVTIKEISAPDSVFENAPLTQEAYDEIIMRLKSLNTNIDTLVEQLTPESLDYGLWLKYDLISRMEKVRTFLMRLPTADDKGAFKGWRVKAVFDAAYPDGTPYSSEYWFFIDKNKKFVYDSFEIPII